MESQPQHPEFWQSIILKTFTHVEGKKKLISFITCIRKSIQIFGVVEKLCIAQV